MNTKKIIIRTVFVLLVYVCTACNNAEKKSTLKIGGIFCQTGAASDYGVKSVDGIRIALDQINRNGGINGMQVELILEDSRSAPKDAISALRKLTTVDNLHIILGDVYSSTAKVLIQNLPPNTLLFAPGASKPDLTSINKNFVRNWTSDDFDGLAIANVMIKDSIREVATLIQIDDYATSLKNAFKLEFNKKGGRIISEEYFESEKKDYRSLINKLKNGNIKTVYLVALSREMGIILKQAKELDFRPQWYTNLSVNKEDCKKIAGDAVEGVVFSQPYVNWTNISPSDKEFLDTYKKLRNQNADETVAHAYDAMNIIAMAVRNAGTQTDSLVNYINKIRDFPGMSGKTTFDGKGGVLKDIEILKFVDKKPKSLNVYRF